MAQEQHLPGFPKKLVSFVRCLYDGAEIALVDAHTPTADDCDSVQSGAVVCSACGSVFRIEGGILNLLDQSSLDEESANEQRQRNEDQSTFDAGVAPEMRTHHEMEMLPTLEALPVTLSQTILEVGCGEGRYTTALAGRTNVLAVDFSIGLLRVLQRRLPPGTKNVGLVLGDVTTFKAAPGKFEYALSTLTSNLPSRKHREALYRLAQTALMPEGRFVFSSHLQGIRKTLAGQKKSDHYAPGGIYRYNFGLSEAAAEVRPYFNNVDAKPIQIYFPLSRSLGLPTVRLSRMLERIPIVNLLGELVLVQANQPRETL
jgi:SAM-dependent methyltransferase